MHGFEFELPNSSVIIDIGSNAGYFSLFACNRFSNSKIFAFEPIIHNFKLLEINQKLNKPCQIIAVNKAVTGYSGEVTMRIPDYDDGFSTSAHIVDGEYNHNKTHIVKVQCTTIQEIFNEYELEKCDLLKMDCEGAEFDIIYNCPSDYLSRITQTVMEFHDGPKPKENIEYFKEYLLKQGFKTRTSKRALGMLWASKIK